MTFKRIITLSSFLMLFIGSMLLTSCKPDYKVDNRQLIVSIEPLRYITETIAGDCYAVSTLTPEGVSPETYMPTPQQLTSINQGTAYIYLGALGFEQQHIDNIVDNCPHLYVINVSEHIKLLDEVHCSHTTDSADPHVWTSPNNMKTIANNICRALCEMDSANMVKYTQHLKEFELHMDSIEMQVHDQLDTLQHRSFLINHPALAYFADQFQLHQLSIEQNGKDASAKRVAELIDECKKQNVKNIFIQKQNSGRTAERIAEEIGCSTTTINPLSYRWDLEMLDVAKTLAK